MGKKQHQKDKLYLTCTEWKTIYGGKKVHENLRNKCRKMPFNYCNLKLVPSVNPCCTREGIVFDLQNILEYLKKNKLNPLTGKRLKVKDLIRLHIHKNLQDEFHCPITYKQFNDTTKIVVVPSSGHVYSMEGLVLSNLKTDVWLDPLGKEEFNKKDLIIIQDPDNLDRYNMNAFFQETKSEEEIGTTIRVNSSLAAVALKEVQELAKHTSMKSDSSVAETIMKDKVNEAHFSTGKVAASFTSTSAPVAYVNETATLSDDTVRYSRISEKGYVTLITNFGKINLELYCDTVPKTCENFIKLCKSNYYDNTQFHRLIRHFVLQGGDPSGTGTGGQSCWGAPFKDEILAKYSHNARGILSMANSGPNTNKSQFFILFRPAKHLDKKHTIFGHLVGGMKVLDAIEETEVDNKDRPIESIEIICTEVFVDPFEKVDEQIRLEREQMRLEEMSPKVDDSLLPRNRQEEEEAVAKKIHGTLQYYQAQSKAVGKFLIPALPDDVQSHTSRKSTTLKRTSGINDKDNSDDLEVSEYRIKQIKRAREKGDRFEGFSAAVL